MYKKMIDTPYGRLGFVLVVSAVVFIGCGSGGGESIRIDLNVVMGPIVGATVRVSPLNDRENTLYEGVTDDSDNVGTAGGISISIPPEYADVPLYLAARGGVDIDADDDGIRDAEPTANDMILEFAIPNSSDLEGFRVIANPLLKFASKYAIAQVENETDITSEDVRTILRRVAKALIAEDVDGNNEIDWKDITSFHPTYDKTKSRIPWDYLLEDIARERREYFANLDISYYRSFSMDPINLEPIDKDNDGNWRNDDERSFDLYFSTNKNGYTMRDVIEGIGLRGGSVTLPGSALFSYNWYHCDQAGNVISETVLDDPTPPLFLQCTPSLDDMENHLFSLVGGGVTAPLTVPVGEYTIVYKTGDDLEHQEILYVYENTDETYFLAYPLFETDDDGFLVSISLRFEDTTGNILEDPPILGGTIYLQLKEPVDTINQQVRGESFYAALQDDPAGWYVFVEDLDIFSPAIDLYPENNGHRIYMEDIGIINLPIYTGDGVQRSFYFIF